MSKDILLAYRCPCGKYHEIYWSNYKHFIEIKKENPDTKCYCIFIEPLVK